MEVARKLLTMLWKRRKVERSPGIVGEGFAQAFLSRVSAWRADEERIVCLQVDGR